ncbi:penicillin acylase family protein [Leucobacter viscericola]|uniref:Penicillin acylase family protein n=1 Tax=Leucobacter viscericola TaxID=2714935 RepID=A0A6G7XDK4_9MICO|nr:penicillin acylase family protein [Leucobacter viscericola]QIK62674.1 penicillin acylase family protein [Leucobacter viscericola]
MQSSGLTQPTDSPELEDASRNPKAKKRPRRRLRRALLIVLSTVVVIALAAIGFGTWTVTRSFPQVSGEIAVAAAQGGEGLRSDVTVQRDERGIATITAENTGDLFFAQGFVHAQDRFWEMDFRRHMTAGRLSELFGESQLGTDKFLRTLGWHRIAEKEVDALPAETRAFYQSYADGVNAYLKERQGSGLSLEYAVLGLQNADYTPEPWTPADSVAWFKAMAWDLRTNIEDETERALLAQKLDTPTLKQLYPEYPFGEHPVILADDPAGAAVMSEAKKEPSGVETVAAADVSSLTDAVDQVDEMVADQGEGVGSNSWVVAGEHTATGKPLLANDPHLGAALPSVWTQMQLRCKTVTAECPFDVAGFSFSGLPGIVIGHNQHVAWGFTNLTTDVADLYVERVSGENYLQDGKQHPIETREETIKVAGGKDVPLTVRSTGHGPIVSGLTPDFTAIADNPRVGDGVGAAEKAVEPSAGAQSEGDEYALSLRWTALDVTTTPEAIFKLNTATNFTQFRAAAKLFDVPAQNLIYADLEGNIGYQAPGKLPIRGAGDGWLPQPGWDSAYDWQGFIPFEDQPTTYNPKSGYVVTANNAIVNDNYPYFLSRDWDYGYRAARIVELLENKIDKGPVTAKDMAQIQMDNQFPAAKSLQQAYANVSVDDGDVNKALSMLKDWNGQNDPDSAAAAFANVLWRHVTAQMVDEFDVDVPRSSQSRFAVVFEQQLNDPESKWWQSAKNGNASNRQEFFELAAKQAYKELVKLQGDNPKNWNWGKLHALSLTSGTFGQSGIAPIEWLFNRGPYSVGGGSGVVNATGWSLDDGYETTTVPSMRTVMDPSDWDASTWQNLTGQSGHAFSSNYTDQTEGWAKGEQYGWAFSPGAVKATTTNTLVLRPATD